ncbi:MAG: DUF4465 domain-containing protein [Edaphocola sp.]
MKKTLHASLIALGIASLSSVSAQTTGTFDDLTLPATDTSYAATLTSAQDFSFQTGLVKFYGTKESWGGYSYFNYSNSTLTGDSSYLNDITALPAAGFQNSANYGIAYLPSNWPSFPNETLLGGAKLTGAAVGNVVAGFYVANTLYAYNYITTGYQAGDSLTLVVQGYLNNVPTATSVNVDLARYGTDTTIVKGWQWVALSALGNIDSLSFQLFSSDDYTPFYFAIDNIITLDGGCPIAVNTAADSITESSAKLSWNNTVPDFGGNYQLAIDQSYDVFPQGTIVTTADTVYEAGNLTAGTTYYLHLRSACTDGTFGDWDTLSFTTTGSTGIGNGGYLTKNLELKAYPNPASTSIDIEATMPVNIAVYGMDGKLVTEKQHTTTVDVHNWANGLYMIKATSIGNGATKCIMISKE